jgi:glutamate carboxypeptidase
MRLRQFVIGLFAVPVVAHAQLSAPERSIASAVDRRSAESIALLKRLVDINSGTMNFPGVRAVGDALRTEFDALGFTTRWMDGAAFNRAGHLVAEHPGPGPKILLIGHLDTVFEPTSPFQKFEMRADSMAGGPGIIDMKGGNVIIVAALKALKDAGALAGLNITVVFDGDEEAEGKPTSLSRAALVGAAQGAAVAIGFEDGPGDPALGVIARRSATTWKLTTKGLAGHASQIFRDDLGAGAVNEAARIISEFYQKLAGEQYLAFSAGMIVGGSGTTIDSTLTNGTARGKTNVIAEQVVVTGDMRTISPEQLSRTQAAMRAIVARHLPHTDAAIEFLDGYPPMAPTDGNRRLLSLFDKASQDLGLGAVAPVDPSRAGAADVAFIAHLVPMVIDGVGLSGHDDHSDKETADLRKLSVQAKRAAVLLHRLNAMPDLRASVRP